MRCTTPSSPSGASVRFQYEAHVLRIARMDRISASTCVPRFHAAQLHSQEVASFEALFTMGVFVGRGGAGMDGGLVSVRDTVYFSQVGSILHENTHNGKNSVQES